MTLRRNRLRASHGREGGAESGGDERERVVRGVWGQGGWEGRRAYNVIYLAESSASASLLSPQIASDARGLKGTGKRADSVEGIGNM